MAGKKVHVGWRAVMGAALAALVVVAGIALVMLRTAADPVLHTISAGFWESPLVVDESTGHAFVDIYAGGHSRFAMLDTRTGAIVRTIAIPGWVGALGVDEQAARIVVASPKGVSVLHAHNGALVRLVHLSPTPDALVVDARTGRIYVASSGTTSCTNQACTTSDDALAVLDARTGRLLHTTRLHSYVHLVIPRAAVSQSGRWRRGRCGHHLRVMRLLRA
jgi:DNA-binding beta-propeller fold protein YncE